MPWDEGELEAVNLKVLRHMCVERGVKIANAAHRKTCVSKLLEWQKSEAGSREGTLGDTDAIDHNSRKQLSKAQACASTAVSADENKKVDVEEEVCHNVDAVEAFSVPVQSEENEPAGRVRETKSDSGAGKGVSVTVEAAPTSATIAHSRGQPHATRQRRLAATKTFQGHSYSEWRTVLKNLIRDTTISEHSGTLRQRQWGNGAYTLRPLPSSSGIQVDHVFECQAMGDVMYRVETLRPIISHVDWTAKSGLRHQPIVVQNAFSHLRDVHNRLDFLAATDSLVNKKKQGAFQRVLNKLAKGECPERGLQAELATSFASGTDPFGSEAASVMAKAVTTSLSNIEYLLTDSLRDVPHSSGGPSLQLQLHYDGLADEIVQLYDRFDITRRA